MSTDGLFCTSCDGWTEPREDGRCIMCGCPGIPEAHLDDVDAVLTDVPASPSTIGRKAKLTSHQSWMAVQWLVRNRMAVAVGNGTRTKYRLRRAGERVTW